MPLGIARGHFPKNTMKMSTLKRYAVRGQLSQVYVCNPNPHKEGRSLGYVICESAMAPIKNNAHDANGWLVVLMSPSTTFTRNLT